MTADALELNQTLHGYGDGHQLLSSSLRLTREQQWQLAVDPRGGFRPSHARDDGDELLDDLRLAHR